MMDDEKHYLVAWVIDVWAESPEDAARQALGTQRDPNSIATVFHVMPPDGPPINLDAETGRRYPLDVTVTWHAPAEMP